MENLSQILIHLLSLEVDVPKYYRQSDAKNIIGQTKIALEDVSGFLFYKDETLDLSACIIVNPEYSHQTFINSINNCFLGQAKCDLQYQWWINLNDSDLGNVESPLYNYDSFAYFFLSWIAWQIFSHPLSHAGISNDNEIITNLNTQNIGKGFMNSILGLSGESLGSLYYQIQGNDAERFVDVSGTTNTVSFLNNRFSMGIQNNGTVSIVSVNIPDGNYDISGYYATVSTALGDCGIFLGISGETLRLYSTGSQFAITFMGAGVCGETMGFSNQGSYVSVDNTIWASNPINLEAALGYKQLPFVSGDTFRFQVDLQGYSVLNNGSTLEEKGDTLFTLSLLLE